ncbi:TKL protein kinase [Phytophthora cinnamomi]|uniref:TKL protein kinase n=1 Tax=Phytophthora cinnamomi TaxID=4785 RepID=UPI00355A00DF|nr:TKL protein kinase [Phytophthora cinnamomi]
MGYLNGTLDVKLRLEIDSEVAHAGKVKLEGYGDADYAADRTDRKSGSGGVLCADGRLILNNPRAHATTTRRYFTLGRQQTQDRRHLVHRIPSPTFKLKIETNLDADGNCAAPDARQEIHAAGFWNDPVVASTRIPMEEVVAKELLPEIHENDDHVDGFLAEVKITATLNHPYLVRFMGVAWTSTSDLCVVLEFMDGGNLRSLLDRYIGRATRSASTARRSPSRCTPATRVRAPALVGAGDHPP